MAMKQTPTSGPNLQQQKAIHVTEGPLLIIAGPGSGKTFTLVERIYYLISEKGIPPERLFVSTFTEKAAAELITRISSRLAADNIAVNLNEMYVGTFHSICLRFLEENRESTRLKRTSPCWISSISSISSISGSLRTKRLRGASTSWESRQFHGGEGRKIS